MGTGVERPSYAHGVPRRAFLVVPILALLVAGCSGGSGSAAQDGASPFRSRFEGAEFGSPKQLADFALRDQRGELVRLSSQRGKVVLVTLLVRRHGLGCAVFDAAARPNAFVHDVRLLLAG